MLSARLSKGWLRLDCQVLCVPSHRDWFVRAMHLLAGARQLWEASSPVAIAGFAITRDAAEAALAAHPPGAFLLR